MQMVFFFSAIFDDFGSLCLSITQAHPDTPSPFHSLGGDMLIGFLSSFKYLLLAQLTKRSICELFH